MKAHYKREALQKAIIATNDGNATVDQVALIATNEAMTTYKVMADKVASRLSVLSGSYRVVCPTDRAARQALHLLGTVNGVVSCPTKATRDRLHRFGAILIRL